MSRRLELSLDVCPIDNIAKQGLILEIARGEAHVREFAEGQAQINAYVIPRGGFGGKHQHPLLKDETGYTVYGKIRITLEDPGTKERYSRVLEPGFRFRIMRGFAHRIDNVGEGEAVFLETATMEFAPGKDTVSYEM